MKAVIFDCDGTLVDSEILSGEVLVEAVAGQIADALEAAVSGPVFAFPGGESGVASCGGFSEGLAALIVACVAQAARDIDAGIPFVDLPGRMIEENVWRAVRYGLDGELLDLERGEPYPAGETLDRLLAWSAPACAELGIDVGLPERNGAQRQRRMVASGLGLPEIYASTVAQTHNTYAGKLGSTAEVTT